MYFFNVTWPTSSLIFNPVTIRIQDFENSFNNEIFDSVQCYLSSKCFSSGKHLKLSRLKNSKNVTYAMTPDQSLEDKYDGIKFNWSFHVDEKQSYPHQKSRYHELSFHNKYKQIVHSSYLPHIYREATNFRFKNRGKLLYTIRSMEAAWSAAAYFSHPSTFDTIAIDPTLKQEIKEDLTKFVKRSEFYNRVGRAWKRGYLLYGPPGTGKTSLIAAIANFLEFDIYDLELTSVKSNSQLRKLLISTTSKSVIVVEDIDCSLDLSNRKNIDTGMTKTNNVSQTHGSSGSSSGSSVSLSGVLNFVDGLWSSCAGERLIIFTTNHKEKLDAALLRPGRMDKHINLSYCGIESFKILMNNYLKIEEHEIVKEVEKMIGSIKMTPADVAEFFMSCDEDAETGLRNVVEEMKKRLKLQSIKHEKEDIENKEDIRKGKNEEELQEKKEQEQQEEEQEHEDGEDDDDEEDVEEDEDEDEDVTYHSGPAIHF